MVPRATYSRDLNAALDLCLKNRPEIEIARLTDWMLARAGFPHETPAPTTLAKLLVNRGWIRRQGTRGRSAVYLAPLEILPQEVPY